MDKKQELPVKQDRDRLGRLDKDHQLDQQILKEWAQQLQVLQEVDLLKNLHDRLKNQSL